MMLRKRYFLKERAMRTLLLHFSFLGFWWWSCTPTPQRSMPVDTPEAALAALLEGNRRFVANAPQHPHQGKSRVQETQNAQHPFAVVVSCSDSRVSPEIIFDEGIGDLFAIRTAGNLVGALELGSIEYAVEHLHVPLVVVLGHTECGAVKAFVEGAECHGYVRQIVQSLQEEKEEQEILRREGKDVTTCVEANVIHGVSKIRQNSRILQEGIAARKVAVVPMIYDVHTGQITLLNEHEWRERHQL